MRKKLNACLPVILAVCLIASCKKSDVTTASTTPVVNGDTTSTPIPAPARETFENGSKDDYAPSTISLSTGKWSFDNAVIGSTAEDKKNGAKSARLQGAGKLTMNFDIVNGVYRVVVASAAFGTDGPGSWQLFASNNSGISYTQVGNTIVTAGATLQSDTIVVATTSKIRFSLRKVSGSTKLNIDDFEAILTSGPLVPNFADDNNMLLGNPDNASPSVLDFSKYYMDKTYYSLSYNSELSKSNWVSWHLRPSDLGTTPRQDNFREDYALPSAWYYVTTASYNGSGFDRGHMCPSNDRTSSVDANSSTFLMTNIIPQAPNCNQIPWARLEDSCNRLVTSLGKELYIVCGSYGVGGVGNNGAANDIDNGRISVPAYVWKVIVVLTNSTNDLNRINNNTRVIAVKMPNTNTIDSDWKNYRVSVDQLEAETGFNLLSNLPDAVQAVVEARVDNL